MIEAPIHMKIPQDRVGALIGPSGLVKMKIEEMCNVEMKIASESGSIEFRLKAESTDPTTIFKAESIITAIGRGFAPEKAFKLNSEDVSLEVIDLTDYVGKAQSELQRIKGRLIGEAGKTRKIVEETTGANISIYGHTVSMIGEVEQLEAARKAVQMLINGRQHSTVYRFLNRRRRELKKSELTLWKTPDEEEH